MSELIQHSLTHTANSFSTPARVHIAFGVKDLEASIAFYQLLFSQAPTKRRSNYAKFEVESSPLNLALNAVSSVQLEESGVAHFGVQVKSTEEVMAIQARLAEAGYLTALEDGVVCCYAEQDKVWVHDPDGRSWEIFVVRQDAEAYAPETRTEGCCEPVRGCECLEESAR